MYVHVRMYTHTLHTLHTYECTVGNHAVEQKWLWRDYMFSGYSCHIASHLYTIQLTGDSWEICQERLSHMETQDVKTNSPIYQ